MISLSRIFNLIIIFTINAYFIVYAANEQSVLNDGAEKIDYRLPTTVEPISYILAVTPHFDNASGHEAFTFSGNVKISLQAKFQGVKEIVLHLKDITIISAELHMQPKFGSPFFWLMPQYKLGNGVLDNITDKYTIPLEQPLTPYQLYVLEIEYIGRLQTNMHGFYRSSYEEDGKTVWLASTLMEPVHARQVFPCFDEPQFKATFQVTITRPADFKPSISNTPILKTIKNDVNGQVHETFEMTPKMSTYLLAFIVSKFECRSNAENTFSVCSRPNAFSQTKYSFDVGQPLLHNFDKIFNYKYSTHMKKMTMAALPDFEAGAMENWGLLTYRETSLLYDEQKSTAMAKQRVAAVIAHEQAHMWFGDLVTCNWWNATFLNEGFARYWQYFGLADIETEWGMEQQFVVDQVQNIFVRDSLDDTFPLYNHTVQSPDDIDKIFGTISYNKGASIIRMIEHTMGHDKFIQGLRTYLKDNALKTAVPDDLYNALQSALGTNADDIGEIMRSWVEKSGYPVVHVSIEDDRKTIKLKQRQFLLNEPKHDKKSLWHIPITYATKTEDFNNTQPKYIFSSDDNQVTLGDEIDWIIFNVQQTGFYRVNYDNKLWRSIDHVLYNSPKDIHVLNRAQIVDDALNLARGEILSYTQVLHTIEYLKNETDYVPWYAALTNFKFILNRFKSDERKIFEEYILSLIEKAYLHLGFNAKENDTRLDVYNRGLIMYDACRLGYKPCLAAAQDAFDKIFQENGSSDGIIPADLKPVVYCTVIRYGSNATWQTLWEKFQMENVAAEQVVILNALGCTHDTGLVQNYINEILGDKIRLQDKLTALVSLLSQPQNVDYLLDYIGKNHEKLTKVFESKYDVPSVLSTLASQITSIEQIETMEKFIEQNKSVLGPVDQLQLSLKDAKYNLKWAERNVPTIKEYLKSAQPHDHKPSSSVYTSMVSVALTVGLPVSVYLLFNIFPFPLFFH